MPMEAGEGSTREAAEAAALGKLEENLANHPSAKLGARLGMIKYEVLRKGGGNATWRVKATSHLVFPEDWPPRRPKDWVPDEEQPFYSS